MSDGDSPKFTTRHFFFEVVEWSEQLRSVTPVWLGAAAAAFKSDSAPAGVWARKKKKFGIIIIIIILIIIIIIIFIIIIIIIFRDMIREYLIH